MAMKARRNYLMRKTINFLAAIFLWATVFLFPGCKNLDEFSWRPLKKRSFHDFA